MYYSNGNYEAFADPKKPAGVDKKSAYIIGSGLAGLSTAVFLVRDAQMKGENIHILEELPVAGGSLDGADRPNAGFVVRGGREMENHFECLWDMYRSIPSLEVPGASYLDEYYWLDKEDPNSSNCRLIYNRGDRLPSDGQYGLGKCANEIVKLIMTPEKEIEGQTIEEFFSDEFFKTNFWTYWSTMFAFEKLMVIRILQLQLLMLKVIHGSYGKIWLSKIQLSVIQMYSAKTYQNVVGLFPQLLHWRIRSLHHILSA